MHLAPLFHRQSCAGGAYYVCQNGFKGCCSVNPCNPDSTCPDTTIAMSSLSSTQILSSSVRSSTTGTVTARSSTPSSSTSATVSSAKTSNSASSASSAKPAATGLSCPGANGTTFTDSEKARYSIRCNADNSYSSFNTTYVTAGGFDQCFGACDNAPACAGFTFVGSDNGQCYLKSSIPQDAYHNTAGSNYVTCTLLERGVQQPSTTPAKPKSSPTAVIAGSVTGGVIALIICVILLTFCIRRRRKKVEEINSATQKSYPSPKESHEDEPLFAPLGGFYRGKNAEAVAEKQKTTAAAQPFKSEAMVNTEHPKTTSGPPELDSNPVYPKADITPVPAPVPAPVEMDGTSVRLSRNPVSPIIDESPVLGRHTSSKFVPRRVSSLVDDVRKRQHIMSWNNYDARDAVSPPTSMSHGLSPRPRSPDISPLP